MFIFLFKCQRAKIYAPKAFICSFVFRLESLSFETKSLIQDASMVKRDGLIYKQRLEKRCSDLQKAEAEVLKQIFQANQFVSFIF